MEQSDSYPVDAPGTDYDPFSLDSMRHVHERDAALLEIGPVVHIRKYDFYAITQFAAVRKAALKWRAISSTTRPFYEPSPFRPTLMLLEDPPEHTPPKQAVMRVFSEKARAMMGEYFKVQAEKMLDEILAGGPVELDGFRDLAMRYVMKVFPDVLGLPEEGRENLISFGHAVFNVFGPDSELRRKKLEAGSTAIDWVEANTARELQPAGSVGWEFYKCADEGLISHEDAQQLLKTVFAAGFDTTNGTLGNMMRAFADHPEEWQKLRKRPELVDNAWEEAVRFYPAVRFGGRWAPEETEVAGVRIPAGTRINLMWLAAGRDPRRYDQPNRFLVDRDLSGGHVNFGTGVHVCGGAAIARLEARIFLKALVDRVERIEKAGEPEMALNYQGAWHERVPIRLVPASDRPR